MDRSLHPSNGHSAAWSLAGETEEARRSLSEGARFWLWLVLGLCLLALIGILGGYAFGIGMVRGTHLREQFSMGQDDSGQPMQMGVRDQGQSLLGRTAGGQVRYYSGPSELAAAAARGEVVIDEQGVIHEVELEKLAAAEEAYSELSPGLDFVPETLPPLPRQTLEPLYPEDATRMPPSAHQEAFALAQLRETRTAARPSEAMAPEVDIFFGQ